MADYDDPDPALFRSGNVVWAKVYDRPWWPCVMFNSWAAVRRWNLPVPMEGVAELGEDQAIGIFLDDYEFTVFDKHSNSIQDWDYITPEAILEELGGDPSRKNLKKAIRDGKRLVRISRGGARAAPDDEDRYAEPAPQRGGYRGKKKRGGYRGPREPKAKPRQNDFFSPLFGATVPAGAAPPPVLPATAGPLAPAKRATRARSPRAADVDDDRDGSSLSSGSKRGEVTPATSEPGDDDDGGAAPRTSRAGRVTRKPRKLRDDDDAAAPRKKRARPVSPAGEAAAAAAPRPAGKRPVGRPRSGKTKFNVGDYVFAPDAARVVWTGGVVVGVETGPRRCDDAITVVSADGGTHVFLADRARKTAPHGGRAPVVSPSASASSLPPLSDDVSVPPLALEA